MKEVKTIDTVKVVRETDEQRFAEKVLEIVEDLQNISNLEVEIQYDTVVTGEYHTNIRYIAYITGYHKTIIM